jgi:hypothetical protein
VYPNIIFCHIQATERECESAANPVQDSDVETEHPEHILGQSSNKVHSKICV